MATKMIGQYEEIEYRGCWIYRLTDGRYGTSGHPVDAESLRDSRFIAYESLEAAQRRIDENGPKGH